MKLTQTPPPDYANARSRRQRQRAAGLHPDYWYAVEWDHALRIGEVKEFTFWKHSVAIYRGSDGVVRAMENRCAHRSLKLSLGSVDGCQLTCAYHGWRYDETGRCVSMEHSLFGKKMPHVELETYPVQVRYGLIFVFMGNKALASERRIPEIPQWDNPDWGKISIDFTWNAHHSIIIDNTCDFTHAHLHRNRKPFTHAELTSLEAQGDQVTLTYDTQVGQGRFSKLLVNRKTTKTNAMTLGYQYPYQWSDTDQKIKHWAFVLPISESRSRVFFLFYFSPEMVKVPLLPLNVPRPLVKLIMPIAKRLIVHPLLKEDEVAVEAEQAGYEAHHDKPSPDVNPVLAAFQTLTLRKWDEYLASLSPRERVLETHGARPEAAEPALGEQPPARA
ncbi:MAG: aromatic ring-hydroxylating dioxygenase subunit alpha [Myxococcaceae bacterium]|nr:aromatic ring-hydroxylating dioxygenase subunit alpha [Myxococcaceae bacterium]